MKKLSSDATFFYKRVFPILWFGILGGSYSIVFLSHRNNPPPIVIFIPAVFMLIIGGFLFKKLLWSIADEVLDEGDSLLVRDGGKETRVPLSQIININCSTMVNPSQVLVIAHNETGGTFEFSFMPTRVFSFTIVKRHPLIEELIMRVDRARRA